MTALPAKPSPNSDASGEKSPLLSLVVAAAANNAIGKNNDLLWRLPNDMKFFKNTTWAMPVIMGRKSYDGIGKALTGRANYVVSRQTGLQLNDAIVCPSLTAAIDLATLEMQTNEIMVIGGGELYAQALPLSGRVYLTRVHANFDGDTFFPELPAAEWQLARSNAFVADEKHLYDYTFEVWDRIYQR